MSPVELTFLIMISAINPFRMNFPVFTDEKIRNINFCVIVPLNFITNFYPCGSIVVGQSFN